MTGSRMVRRAGAKTAAFLLAFLLCGSMMSAAAQGNGKTYTLRETEDGLTIAASEGVADWELPDLPAGQTRAPGELQLVNTTGKTAWLTLQEIQLPYDDPVAMRYLDQLHITVKNGNKVLYDGAYSRIMDKNGLRLSVELAPQGIARLSVSMHCAFTYTGQADQDTAGVAWRFAAAVREEGNGPDMTVLLLIAGGVVLLLLVVWLILTLVKRRRR